MLSGILKAELYPRARDIRLGCLACLGFWITLAVCPLAASETPSLFAELAPGVAEADTFQFAAAVEGDTMLFWGDDGRRGQELWITDGSQEGTRLWTEVCPGECRDANPEGSSVGDVVFDGQRAFFLFDDGIHGRELWTADGSEQGTRLVADLCPGACDPSISSLTWIEGRVFFGATTPALGSQPWTSNGTKEGTQPLGNIEPGLLNASPETILQFGGGVAFRGMTDEHGMEWWGTDSPMGDALRLTDLCPGPCSIEPLDSLAYDGGLVFNALTETGQDVLYRLESGSTLRPLATLCEAECSLISGPLFLVNDRVYTAREERLWVSDGTVEGTRHLLDLQAFNEKMDGMVEFGDGGALLAMVRFEIDWSFWLLQDENLTPFFFPLGFFPQFAVLGDRLILAEEFGSGVDLIATDGTGAGPRSYAELPPERQWETVRDTFFRLGEHVVFAAKTPGPSGLSSLFTTRGETDDVEALLDIEERPVNLHLDHLASVGSRALFRLDPGPTDSDELWSVDETGHPVLLVPRSNPEQPEVVDLAIGRRAFLKANQPGGRPTAYLSDGTPDNTLSLAADFPTTLLFEPRDPVVLGGELFFIADSSPGQEIWRTDGTRAAQMVVDLEPEWLNTYGCASCTPPILPAPFFPRDLCVIGSESNQQLAFIANQLTSGPEIWRSDGTAEGTELLFDLKAGEEGSQPESLTPAGDGLIFVADVGSGRSLWLWEGQGAPLSFGAVSEISASTSSEGQAVWMQRLDERFAIWASDGTLAGTREIVVLPEGVVPDEPLIVVRDLAFFTAADAFGAELWVSNLTIGGANPRRVADLWPGSRGSFPRDLRLFNTQLYFSADDGVHGRELWRLDTRRPSLVPTQLPEIAPGPAPSSPSQLALLTPEDGTSSKVVFFADDGVSGPEIWSVPLPANTEACVATETTLCLQEGRFRVTVAWQDLVNGTSGVGKVLPGTDESGFFWFFNSSNLELVVKVVDGRDLNDAFWFFYGALSDVAYQIDVEDLDTGQSRRYENPQGNLCGQSDIGAFPSTVESGDIPSTPKVGGCVSTETSTCLLDRFLVTIDWRDHDGNEGLGQVASENSQTSLFWFFGPDNIELAVKAIDGRDFNGHFWIFYGALSDVEYTLRVLDTVTGAEAVYRNEPGNLCGQGDTMAFPAGF